MAENASPHPSSKQISFSACSPKNLLKQSGEIPADTTQVLMYGLSAIAAAKAARLRGKEQLLLIAEEEKQNMIVDQPPSLQTSTSCGLAQSNFAPKTSDNTHLNMIPTIYLLPECPIQGISRQHSAIPE